MQRVRILGQDAEMIDLSATLSNDTAADQMPLHWCMGDDVRLDFRHKAAGSSILASEIEAELTRIGYTLKAGDIALIWTGASAYFDQAGYDQKHACLSREATAYLVEREVKMISMDAWGLDRPLAKCFPKRYKAKPNSGNHIVTA